MKPLDAAGNLLPGLRVCAVGPRRSTGLSLRSPGGPQSFRFLLASENIAARCRPPGVTSFAPDGASRSCRAGAPFAPAAARRPGGGQPARSEHARRPC